jgi:hypothetical protein
MYFILGFFVCLFLFVFLEENKGQGLKSLLSFTDLERRGLGLLGWGQIMGYRIDLNHKLVQTCGRTCPSLHPKFNIPPHMEIAKMHNPCEETSNWYQNLHNYTHHVKQFVIEIAQMHKPCETNCYGNCTNAQTM